jgi:hypothetical protein
METEAQQEPRDTVQAEAARAAEHDAASHKPRSGYARLRVRHRSLIAEHEALKTDYEALQIEQEALQKDVVGYWPNIRGSCCR